MSTTSISSSVKLLLSILICEAVGIMSGLLSQTNMNEWLATLNKPSWNPPSWLFGPVWSILYALMGLALWIIWKSHFDETSKRIALIIFALQLFLNFWWSLLFFRFHSPALALADILLMIVVITITVFRFALISRKASWLLVPYLAWVCFAAILNYTIWSMNK